MSTAQRRSSAIITDDFYKRLSNIKEVKSKQKKSKLCTLCLGKLRKKKGKYNKKPELKISHTHREELKREAKRGEPFSVFDFRYFIRI